MDKKARKRFAKKWRLAIDRPMYNGTYCWEWTASKTGGGYGRFGWEGKNTQAHRVIYEFFYGPIPERLDIDHLCRFRDCSNPEHLEAVTRMENIRRGATGKQDLLHCKNGHMYTLHNTRIDYRSRRSCKTCESNNNKKRYLPENAWRKHEEDRNYREKHPEKYREYNKRYRLKKKTEKEQGSIMPPE